MLNRGSLLTIGLISAMAIPYLASPSSGVRDKVASIWPAAESKEATAEHHAAQLLHDHQGAHHISPAQMEIKGTQATSPAEVFRFDITPDWVLRRWPRVSTRTSDPGWLGYRVPLYTGTTEHSIAGSLTYYFDPKQQLQRITFVGTTGDPRALTDFLASQHYAAEATKEPGLQLYRFKQWDKTVGECLIYPARVVSASAPRAKFEVNLDMRRPARAI
ncbi:MAG: hypothetical protein JNG90_12970 [Planctomycetaceae bacterium]|nr:hypothetical protein [Planctomycetaceae bacterium]